MALHFLVVISIFFTFWVKVANSHGRLMNPPARNCMWRFGYPNPVNYNDNELFCGGYTVQQEINKGKCGVCGDDYRLPQPRPNEIGGTYGNGVIVRSYLRGQDITVNIDITSNHHGFFTFRICPAKSPTQEVTQACLNKNLLKVVNTDGTVSNKYRISTNDRSGSFQMTVRLPPGLICERCVFQWTYKTGNSWGTCSNGTEQVGCGPQENFVNCADVRIVQSSFRNAIDPKVTSTSRANPHMMWFMDYSKENAPLTPLIITYQVCIGTQAWSNIPGIDKWCQDSCMRYPPYCPKETCRCVEDCTAIGDFASVNGADQWCLDQCSIYPPKNCTKSRCACW